MIRGGRRTARGHRWRAPVAVVLVLVVLLAGDAFRLWHGVDRVDLALPGAGPEATNYLLVGTDAWSGHGQGATSEGLDAGGAIDERADIVMVLHVPREGAPRLLSIPRDLEIAFPANGTHRLTLALTRGPQLLVDTLCESLGLGVDHVAMVNLAGFQSLVDAVGGIDVDLPTPLREVPLGLALGGTSGAGLQHLDGRDALRLVRSRHAEVLVDGTWVPVADGAASRVEHSEVVLRALAPRVDAVAQSWWGRHRLMTALAGTVTLDAGAGPGTVDDLVGALRAVGSPAAFEVGRVPVDGRPGALEVRLAPGATEVLRAAGAGANPRCPSVPILASAG